MTVGMIYQPSYAPELLVDTARAAERAGVEEFWLWEDCFNLGGVATMAAALAATERLRVGIGILPFALRSVVAEAMDIAALGRLFPGRARVGLGHGVLEWMGQAGVHPASPLTMMREHLTALRALLDGEEVSTAGRYVTLDRVRLTWPPTDRMPLLAAGEGPKTVALTAEAADGTIVPTGYGPDRVRDIRTRIDAARREAGRDGEHELVVFLMTGFGDDARAGIEAEMDAWSMTGQQRHAAVGDDAAIADAVEALLAAGATSVQLQARSGETDLTAFVDGVARVTERLRRGGTSG